jgi:hypothetical protein
MSTDVAIHKDRTEIRCIWKLKAKLIPVTTGANGTISKSLRQYLSNIPGKGEIKGLQKQPYWALHTDCGKCRCKGTEHV